MSEQRHSGAQADAGKVPPRERWNVFVYLAGDNNLSDEMVWSLLGMEAAARHPEFWRRVVLTAVYDPCGQGPLVYRFPAKSRLKPDHFGLDPFGSDRSPLALLPGLSIFDQLNHFVHEQLQDRDLYPEGEQIPTMIVLSGHGNGVEGMLSGDGGRSLSLQQLGKLLDYAVEARTAADPAGGGKVKILGLEACTMSMVELCYEVRRSVEWLIGTESFVQNNGWPYDRMLPPLLTPQASAEEVAIAMARAYAKYYTEYDRAGVSTDISVVKLDDLEQGVVKPLQALAEELCGLLEPLGDQRPQSRDERRAHVRNGTRGPAEVLLDALVAARWHAQSYNMDGCVDLEDWILELLPGISSESALNEVVKKCRAVLSGLEAVVKLSLYQGPDFQHSHGLSIYFPAALSRYDDAYDDLEFSHHTRWAEFLKLYLRKSRRPVRKEAKADRLYAFDGAGVPLYATQLPGSVRTPPNGTKRQTPANGTRLFDRLDGYTKNRPRAWYRDPRIDPPDPAKPSAPGAGTVREEDGQEIEELTEP